MKTPALIRIVIFSVLITVSGRLAFIKYKTFLNKKYAIDLCSVVGNYLETGSLRDAFEGLDGGLRRSGLNGACVSLIDHGRSFAPNCPDYINSRLPYETVVCRADGNQGVRAEIHLPRLPLFVPGMLIYSLALSILTHLILSIFSRFAVSFSKRVIDELRCQLFKEGTQIEPNLLSKGIDWVLKKTKVLEQIHRQRDSFESEIKSFENTIREEVALRIRKETEIQKTKEFMERVSQIQHDIRSPLSLLRTLQNKLLGNPQLQQSLGSCIQDIQHMMEELNHVKKVEEEPSLVFVEVLVEEMISVMRTRFYQSKQISLSIEYDKNQLSPVMVPINGFRRVLTNIIENAFDAVSVGGRIEIKIAIWHSHCQITVDDNGCGIPLEQIPILFSKGGTFGKINGQGLGLFDAKKNIRKWGGEIEVESLPVGTRFILSFPVTQTGVTYCGIPENSELLVIDDDVSVAENLTIAGYSVIGSATSIEDGKLLIQKLRQLGTIILVDQNLGQSFGDEYRGTDLISELPDRRGVFLCTNDFDNSEVIKQVKHLGIKIIPKPLCFLSEPAIISPLAEISS